MKNETPSSPHKLFKSLKNTILSLYDLAPIAVSVGLVVVIGLIWALSRLTDTMMVGVLVIVFFVSIFIYIKTNNYGEASLALVAGLLTVFTVEWTMTLAITFTAIWIGLSVFAMLYQSIKMAAEHENVFRQAAIWIDFSHMENVEKDLRNIAKNSLKGQIGPIEGAKTIRLLAFNKHPTEFMSRTLESIEMITTVTDVNYETITLFHAELYKMLDPISENRYHQEIGRVYKSLRSIPVPPNDFFNAFEKTRRWALSGRIKVDEYFKYLQTGLEHGLAPEDINNYMANQVGTIPINSV